MADIDDEIDPIKVRAGLFAIITARLEDAHDKAVNAQSVRTSACIVNEHINDIQSIASEIEILLIALRIMNR